LFVASNGYVRGEDTSQDSLFSYTSLEQRIPVSHPLRPIRKMVDEILRQLSPEFSKLYAGIGRRSIAPEKLLRALLLMVLYSLRSERRLMEELEYNLLYRWFRGHRRGRAGMGRHGVLQEP
jgi:transposase